ncbi:unnamed protein product [Chondrus crispus]|uniref:Glycosyltransferase 2-like domain-containing protein n=1 Tax=Chondrus crispus TaxID=2769 RepID=R7QIE9_CHOCR|nr:unnamed protein product [Chondrus crispus]CDF37195.1 unnamed protein product [Chondrus crispus]|eukprot:XP_005717014.1 unnamed protein product [Chondrus crispus]
MTCANKKAHSASIFSSSMGKRQEATRPAPAPAPCGADTALLCAVIVPVYNAAAYLRPCLLSVLSQTHVRLDLVELLLYDDGSTDASYAVACSVEPVLSAALARVVLARGAEGPLGVGAARNAACAASTAPVLVFLDADDTMRPARIARSLRALRAPRPPHAPPVHIVGGVFDRVPAGSTPRYEAYHRRLATADLFVHAFRDTPLAMPTVACLRLVWETVGGFVEGTAVPEDLHFLYSAMNANFNMLKLQGPSLTAYRFHPNMTSLSLHRRTLLQVRVSAFEALVLTKTNWKGGFSIWNSGRDGKDVFKTLTDSAKAMVTAWGDIDPRKIGKLQRDIPILHFSHLQPPIACCVALDRQGREFEANLASLNLTPGRDYVHLI